MSVCECFDMHDTLEWRRGAGWGRPTLDKLCKGSQEGSKEGFILLTTRASLEWA